MINFRYHIVSLTAVFLSLIIGIAMGTTVVSKATVDGLRANLERVEAKSSSVQGKNSELRLAVGDYERINTGLEDEMLNPTVRGVLEDVPVLVIASSGIDRKSLERTLAALTASGANVDGTLVINSRLLLEGDNAQRLADALDLDPRGDIKSTLLTRLATELAQAGGMTEDSSTESSGATSTSTSSAEKADGSTQDPESSEEPKSDTDEETVPPTTVPPSPQEPEALTSLRAAGFLDFRPAPGQSDSDPVLADTGYRYVVVSGEDPDVPDSEFLIPLLETLTDLGPAPLVAVSGTEAGDRSKRATFTSALNSISGIKGRISTVDNLDSFAGQVGLIYALQEVGEGQHGQYGLADGTSAVVPTPES